MEDNRSAQAAPTPTSAELKDASSAPTAFPLLTACPGSVRGAIRSPFPDSDEQSASPNEADHLVPRFRLGMEQKLEKN